MSKGSAIISILIAFVGGILIGHMVGASGSGGVEEGDEIAGRDGDDGPLGAAPTDGVERFRMPVTDAQPWKGTEDAVVTIVEVSDFECPFCSRVEPTISRLMNEYRGKIRVVWRNNPLPFHQNAPMAAQAAMEAFQQGGNEKFWQMHDKIFEGQQQLSRESVERWGQEIGLNMQELRAALDNNEHQALIAADQEISNRLDARGTPHFFINGRKIAGAQPYEQFQTIVEEEIRAGERIVEAGTPAGRVYATLLQNAHDGAAAPAAAGADGQAAGARPQPDPAAVYRVPVGSEPSKGPRDALVTIVEVSDFECPFCSRVLPTVTQIRERYGNDVRVVWFNNPLPFHSSAGPAANAALEAFEQGGNEKFWAMHDLLFANQRALARENLEAYGQQIGLNMAQFRAALDSNEHQAEIQRTQQLAQTLGASGTPSFFINGRNLRGAQPLEAFTAMIDEELTKARAKVAAGTPRARVYEETIRDGATAPRMLPGAAPAAAAPQPAEPPPDQVYEIPIPRDVPSRGGRNARVTIQEFSDFQCPFCSRVTPTVEQIQREYGDRVRIVWRNYPLPFHSDAPLAAEAAWEAFRQGGDAKFWAMHDQIFQNQRALTRADLDRYAQAVGLNMQQFGQALDTRRHQARVQQDVEAINTAGARIGTPSFFINGRLVQGAQPFEAFKAAIDRALAGN